MLDLPLKRTHNINPRDKFIINNCEEVRLVIKYPKMLKDSQC